MNNHVYRCTGPCERGSCSLGPACRCREFDGAPMETGSIVYIDLQHEGCGCVVTMAPGQELRWNDVERIAEGLRR